MTEPVNNRLRVELSQLVGENGILHDDQDNLYGVDDLLPKAVALPDSVGEIRDVLNYAADNKLSVIPAGL